ncbi:MAG TPA: MMPL family transporter, partial [Solirubrobacteraceae bacterium]|nr:MMPL family transporter [Solirubrobacteraceae bacterium]
GLLLVVGVALAFLCALTAGSAALALAGRGAARARLRGEAAGESGASLRARGSLAGGAGLAVAGAVEGGGGGRAAAGAVVGGGEGVVGPKNRVPPPARGGHALFGMLAPAWQGAREILTDNAASRFVSSMALDRAVRHPGRVLGVGLVLAVLGWGLDTQTQVQTDISKLAPQNLSSLHNLDELERVTGVGGEIDLMVSSDSLTKLATIEWMSAYESAILKRFGYSPAKGCGRAQLCPAFSLPDLFHDEEGSTTSLTQKGVNGLLAALPPYFSEDVITRDRHVATLAFGIRLMSLQQQQQVIETMQSSLHPPAGVSARLVGLSVLAAQAGAQIASPWRRVVTLLVALAAVALILLVAFRGDRRRALVPLAPIVLATGWSALVVFALRIPLNPMSVTLGALVIAISTEFSVLLSERHRQERLAGHPTVQALRRAYRYTGAAVAASGVTAIAGFGVLVLSDIAMLRDFGLVTLVDLSVSLLGVLIALPAAVVLAESEQPLRERVRDGMRSLKAIAPRWRAKRRGLTAP